MSISLITEINFTKICRICLLESEEMHSIFSVLQNEDNQDHFTYVYEILMNISSIKILTEDQMPTALCSTCLELANTSYKFQQQCNRSQIILETYLTQINTSKPNESNVLLCDTVTKKELSNAENVDFFDDSQNNDEDNMVNINEINFVNVECSENKLTIVNTNKTKVNTKIEKFKEEQVDSNKVASLKGSVRHKTKLITKKIRNCNMENNFSIFSTKKLSHYLKTTDKGCKVYACNICDKTYKFGSGLRVHMRTHTLERPYVCTVCGKDFKQYGSLTYHLRSHSGEQPYKCKLCGKKYKQSGSLKAHMRIHTGQRPFLCSVCGRGFRQAPDLGYHMRTHTKEKPYMCNICGKTMSMQCHLVQHIRTHTGERPYKCTECDKAFPSTTRLKRHAIIHTGLKPYTCDVCERSFNRKSTLRVHAKIHTDDRPHVCSVCGKGFIQAHSLRTHVATHYTSVTNADISG